MQKLSILSACFAIFLCLVSNRLIAEVSDDIELPDISDSTGTFISPREEKELGNAFFRNIHRQLTINQDLEVQSYIQSIGHKLAAHADPQQSPFHFFVVIDKNLNAFAGPGGYIGINSGLILATESESELASVISHEIAHVTQRHLYRAFEAASQLSLPTAAATLAAILIGSQSPELGQAALLAVQANSMQQRINFTRSNEQEADRVGMQTLVKADFDPNGMPTFFERLQQNSRYYGQAVPEFLRTHPVTASRISDTRNRAEKQPYRHYPDSFTYRTIRTKLRVLGSKNLDATRRYFLTLTEQGTPEQRAIANYGLGWVALKQQHFKEAQKIFSKLQKTLPEKPTLHIALAETATESRHYPEALAILKKARQRFPNHTPLSTLYLSTLIKTGQAQQARQEILPLIHSDRQNPKIYHLLAQAYGKLQQPIESYRYLAEYYYLTGRTEKAIEHIKTAKNFTGINFYQHAILDQRLAFFIEEERILKLGR
ncbi:MAG: M48 family metallopeptidase [Methylococcales bacterium]|nr:M48 family metallopeptidase [Methylococcales bacterium]